MPLAPPQTSGNNATTIANSIGKTYGPAARAAYLKMVAKYPQYTPLEVAKAFFTEITAKGLKNALQSGVTGVGSALGAAAGSGFGTDFLGNLGSPTDDWKHLLLRIGEFIIGLGLVALGVWAIVRKTDTYKAAEKTAISAAAVVPK